MIYTLDTNLWIDALREPAERERLKGFLSWALPSTVLASVVAAELLAGARTDAARRALKTEVVDPFDRRGRVRAPSVAAWLRTGLLLGQLGSRPPRRRDGWQTDLLLGWMARELGWVVVTRDGDFGRLQVHIRGLQVHAPYPEQPGS